jgi:hypothetical protein
MPLTGKQQGIFSKSADSRENPSRKHLPIQQFARGGPENSLRDGTGNQFDHNRELIRDQQGINPP